MCACEYICLQRPQEGIRSQGAVAKGGCKLPDMRLGTKLRSAGRAANALNPEPSQLRNGAVEHYENVQSVSHHM